MAATTVSAPGKVLVAGGYLVLDPSYFGVVYASDARFYAHVVTRHAPATPDAPHAPPTLRVRSPQFHDAAWVYEVHVPMGDDVHAVCDGLRLVQSATTGANPFVALTLLYAVQLGVERLGAQALRMRLAQGLDVVLAGDNDFYSHRVAGHAPSVAELEALPPLHPQACTLDAVHKTGLGSSAAMTTALTAGVLLHLGIVAGAEAAQPDALPLASLGLIHNTAQLAHCAAQGKVGSGFDVSASVWGSQLYRRFDPRLVQEVLRDEMGVRILASGGAPAAEEAAAFAPQAPCLLPLLDAHNPLWQPAPPEANGLPTAVEGLMELVRPVGLDGSSVARPAPLALPPGVRLCLADVDTGSNTRTLVGQVRTFQKTKPDWAAQLFRVLGAANQALADGLLSLHVAHARDADEYAAVLAALAGKPAHEWEAYQKANPSLTADLFVDVRNTLRSVRAGMRELGTRADAPLEPGEMTRILDASVLGARGVLGGGVPGAGGYDALYLFFLHPASLTHPDAPVRAPEEVCAVWRGWTESSVGPLLSGADRPGRTGGAPPPTLPADVDPAVARVAHDLLRTRAGVRVHAAPDAVPGLAAYTAGCGADSA